MAVATKIDLYQVVTDAIIAKLESGVCPWSPGWASAKLSRPLRSCGIPYQGVNVVILWFAALEAGYTSPFWLTFEQAKKLGGSVRKGEKSSRVVFFQPVVKSEESASGETLTKSFPILKSYCVFNANQIDGLPDHFYPKGESVEINAGERIASFDEFVKATGAHVVEEGNQAKYSRVADRVSVPPFAQFASPEDYASTLAHELIHWTGVPGRLDRQLGKRFGDAQYAAEELVAELGAAFILADLGICSVPRDDHANYLASWLKVLKADKRALFSASALASKAAEYLAERAGMRPVGVPQENSSEGV